MNQDQSYNICTGMINLLKKDKNWSNNTNRNTLATSNQYKIIT